MALVDDLQGVYQLLAEIGAAAAVMGQGGERVNDRKATGMVAEITLDAPQGDNETPRHLIFLLQLF